MVSGGEFGTEAVAEAVGGVFDAVASDKGVAEDKDFFLGGVGGGVDLAVAVAFGVEVPVFQEPGSRTQCAIKTMGSQHKHKDDFQYKKYEQHCVDGEAEVAVKGVDVASLGVADDGEVEGIGEEKEDGQDEEDAQEAVVAGHDGVGRKEDAEQESEQEEVEPEGVVEIVAEGLGCTQHESAEEAEEGGGECREGDGKVVGVHKLW